tara:strand:- start:140 stop:1156 length:1017 start_codon:yes stop_codon:yes gene_type:complete
MFKFILSFWIILLSIDVRSACYKDGYKYNCYDDGRLYYSGTMVASSKSGAVDAHYLSTGTIFQYLNLTGNGIYYYESGDKYTGSFISGKKDGFGTYEWLYGRKYVGTFKNGKYHGNGTIYRSDGSKIYSGNYEANMREGFGTFYNLNGTINYKGEWKNGDKNGYGVDYFYDGSFNTVSGNYKNGQFDGVMKVVFSPDSKIKNVESRLKSINGYIKYVGKAIITYKDGSKMENLYSPSGISGDSKWIITPVEAKKIIDMKKASDEAASRKMIAEENKKKLEIARVEKIYNQCILDKIPDAKTDAATKLIEDSCREISKNPTSWQIVKYLGWDGLKELTN